MVCANAEFWFAGVLLGDTREKTGRTTRASPRQILTRELSASNPRAAHPWTTTPGRACDRGRVPAAAGSVGHSSRGTEMEGACLFGVGAVPQLEEPRRGGGACVWVANGLRSGGRGGRGVAGLTRGLRGAHRARERRFRGGVGTRSPGAGAAACGDGGAMEQRERGGRVPRLPGELGAKWSLLGMRPPWFPSPTLPSPSWGCQGYPLAPSGELG